MLALVWSKRFKKDYAKSLSQGKDMGRLDVLLELLIDCKTLPEHYKDHPLKGNWSHYRECHVEFDWVLLYRLDKKNKSLLLAALGSHSEIL